jgi:hypothetical protein
MFMVGRAQEISPNRWHLSTKLHSVTSQMTIIVILIAVRTSNLKTIFTRVPVCMLMLYFLTKFHMISSSYQFLNT